MWVLVNAGVAIAPSSTPVLYTADKAWGGCVESALRVCVYVLVCVGATEEPLLTPVMYESDKESDETGFYSPFPCVHALPMHAVLFIGLFCSQAHRWTNTSLTAGLMRLTLGFAVHVYVCVCVCYVRRDCRGTHTHTCAM